MLRLVLFLGLGLHLEAQARYVPLSASEPSCPLAISTAKSVDSAQAIDRSTLTPNGYVLTFAKKLAKDLGIESGQLIIKDGDFHDFPRPSRPDASTMVVYDGSSKPYRLLDQRGKVVVLSYWSLVCRPSLNLLSELASLQSKQDKFGFTVFPLHASPELQRQFQLFLNNRKTQEDRTNYFTPGKGAEGFLFLTDELPALPVTFLIDRNGRLARLCIGFQPKSLEKGIAQLLGEKAEPPAAPLASTAR